MPEKVSKFTILCLKDFDWKTFDEVKRFMSEQIWTIRAVQYLLLFNGHPICICLVQV